MKSHDNVSDNVGLVTGFYDAMLEEEKKKLRTVKCTSCKKTIFYRVSTLGDADLKCKSCGTVIKVEKYKTRPLKVR